MEYAISNFTSRQYMIRDDFEAFHFVTDEPIATNPHDHSFFEILFFAEGHISYVIDDKEIVLVPGDMLLIPPHIQHYPRFIKSGRYRRNVIWITPEYIESLEIGEIIIRCFTHATADYTHCGHFKFEPVDRYRLFSCASTLAEELMHDKPFQEEISHQLISEILLLICRFSSPYLAVKTPCSREVVSDVLAYIETHLAYDLTLDHLADHFFISKYHLSRIFKKQMGTSPYNYIIQRRLRCAKDMMDAGTSPLEASKKCGYKNYPSFYRAFIKKYGCPPKDISCLAPSQIAATP